MSFEIASPRERGVNTTNMHEGHTRTAITVEDAEALPSDATLHLATHASLVVLAILAVCGLADVAHVYIEDLFVARGYLSERAPRYAFYNIAMFWTTYAALVP